MIDDRDYGPPNTELDAIMVLGGGLCPDGGIPPWVIRRLDAATHLYSLQPNNANGDKYGAKKCKVLLLGAGTPHKPAVVDSHGYVLHESTAYATYLMAQGVPACDILKETSSYDTVGNGYFSATMHAVPARWRQLAVITSHFHMSRAEAIFEATYALAGGDLLGDVDAFQLVYYPVSDAGLFDAEVLRARAEKEAKAVAAWRGTVAGMRTMADLHAWLFATHLCYSVSRQHEFGQSSDLDPRLAATY